jgi:signal transduction histidine kinase
MQQVVSKNWYTIFNGFCLFVSLLLIILAISVNSSLHQDLGADSSTALIAGLNVAAIAAVFFFFRNKPFYRIASYLGSIFFILNLIDLIIHTNPGFSFIYFIVWMLVVFYSGAFGEQALVCFGLVTAVFVLVEDNFTFTNSNKDLLVLLIGTFVIGIASYIIFWRSMYTAYRAQNNQRLKNLSKMLNSDEQRSEILIESITDGVIVVDNSGIITLINESAAQMVAWLVNEAIGIDVHLVVKLNTDEGKPIAGTEDPFSIALINKTKVNRTVELVGRNEKTTITSLIVSPVIVPGKTETSTTVGIVAVMRDISAQVAGDKQKADFVSTASHEMRTPIAAIEGYLSLAMNDKVARIDTKAREYLDKAYSSTQHLSELFQDLLTSSKAEDGRISNHPEVVEDSRPKQKNVGRL